MLKYIALGLIGAVVALAVYVRLAPINGQVWNDLDLPFGASGELAALNSFTVVRDVEDGASAMSEMDAIVLATPRTTRVAGSVETGRVTYMTRSRFMGYPDFTTIAVQGGALVIFARARFGKSDLGVNRARVTEWLNQLDATS